MGPLRIILLQMGIKLPHVGKKVIKKDDDIHLGMKQSAHEVYEYCNVLTNLLLAIVILDKQKLLVSLVLQLSSCISGNRQ
jgi:hypothetical protein